MHPQLCDAGEFSDLIGLCAWLDWHTEVGLGWSQMAPQAQEGQAKTC